MEENQIDEHFNETISTWPAASFPILLVIQQFPNNFISKSEQFRHNTITFLLIRLQAFHFQTKNHQNLCFPA